MTTSAKTVSSGGNAQPRKKTRVNRWDSPWLNPKFIIGLCMVLSIPMLGIIGQIFWDPALSYPASSPLNLPPAWMPKPESAAPQAQPDAAAPSSDSATPRADTATAAPQSGGAVTGGNPFQQQATPATSSVTGGNPFQQKTTPTVSSVTGGNPLARPTAENAAAQPTARPVAAGTAGSSSRFGVPTWEHPLGTESNGRDMLAVLLVGAPRSLYIGLIAATIGMGIGILLGFTAGYLGGWVDAVIRTISDSVVVIPALAVLIVIGAYVRTINIENMAILLALFAWPGPTRLIRAQVLSMRERGYVQMARISGAGSFHIMFLEMMPNMLPYLAASYTGNVSAAILAATSLEVLGLGPTRIPTLGMTIFYAIRAAAILRGMWWWWGIPIAALVIVFSGLFLMTVGLDEIANPRLRGLKAAT